MKDFLWVVGVVLGLGVFLLLIITGVIDDKMLSSMTRALWGN